MTILTKKFQQTFNCERIPSVIVFLSWFIPVFRFHVPVISSILSNVGHLNSVYAIFTAQNWLIGRKWRRSIKTEHFREKFLFEKLILEYRRRRIARKTSLCLSVTRINFSWIFPRVWKLRVILLRSNETEKSNVWRI